MRDAHPAEIDAAAHVDRGPRTGGDDGVEGRVERGPRPGHEPTHVRIARDLRNVRADVDVERPVEVHEAAPRDRPAGVGHVEAVDAYASRLDRALRLEGGYRPCLVQQRLERRAEGRVREARRIERHRDAATTAEAQRGRAVDELLEREGAGARVDFERDAGADAGLGVDVPRGRVERGARAQIVGHAAQARPAAHRLEAQQVEARHADGREQLGRDGIGVHDHLDLRRGVGGRACRREDANACAGAVGLTRACGLRVDRRVQRDRALRIVGDEPVPAAQREGRAVGRADVGADVAEPQRERVPREVEAAARGDVLGAEARHAGDVAPREHVVERDLAEPHGGRWAGRGARRGRCGEERGGERRRGLVALGDEPHRAVRERDAAQHDLAAQQRGYVGHGLEAIGDDHAAPARVVHDDVPEDHAVEVEALDAADRELARERRRQPRARRVRHGPAEERRLRVPHERGRERQRPDARPRERARRLPRHQKDSPMVTCTAPLIFHASNRKVCGAGSGGQAEARPRHCAHGCRMPRSRRIGPMIVR